MTVAHGGCLDGPRYDRQMIQPLLYQQPDDAIRVEQEVTPQRVLVPDDRVERLELRGLRQGEHRRRQRVEVRGILVGAQRLLRWCQSWVGWRRRHVMVVEALLGV